MQDLSDLESLSDFERLDKERIEEFEEKLEAENKDAIIAYIYDSESNIVPTFLFIFDKDKDIDKILDDYLPPRQSYIQFKEASDRTKKLSLALDPRFVVYI